MPEYFSHDYDTREDEKIIGLMGEHGWEGYGLFWGIIELLYKNNGKMRAQYKRIAFALNSDINTIQDIIENYDLFQVKKDFFCSVSVNKRLKKRKIKSEVASANAHKRWDNRNANALPTESKRNAKKESKGKESKVKDNITLLNEFWDQYHRITGRAKTDKEATVKYWKKLNEPEMHRAIEMIHRYFNSLSDPKYCKKARTYLADKNFNDEFQPNGNTRSSVGMNQFIADD